MKPKVRVSFPVRRWMPQRGETELCQRYQGCQSTRLCTAAGVHFRARLRSPCNGGVDAASIGILDRPGIKSAPSAANSNLQSSMRVPANALYCWLTDQLFVAFDAGWKLIITFCRRKGWVRSWRTCAIMYFGCLKLFSEIVSFFFLLFVLWRPFFLCVLKLCL